MFKFILGMIFGAGLLIATPVILAEDPVGESTTNVVHSVGLDGYEFEQREFSADTMVIQFNRFNSTRDVAAQFNRQYPNIHIPADSDIRAYSTYKLIKGVSFCIINAVDPAVDYTPETLGHEFTHCSEGNFHPSIVP